MKYTVEGFSQQAAMDLGLDVKDLVFLRWLLDFYNTGKMRRLHSEDKDWFWLHCPYIMEELPILGIESRDAMARRIRRMSKVIECKIFQGLGNQAYYRFKEDALLSLLSDTNGGASDPKVGGVPALNADYTTQKSEGVPAQNTDYPTQKSEVHDPKVGGQTTFGSDTYNDPSIINPSIIDSKTSGGENPAGSSQEDNPEKNQQRFSVEFVKKANLAKAKGFNLYALVNYVYKQTKTIARLPEPVLMKVLDSFFLRKETLNGDAFPYFRTVVKGELKQYCIQLQKDATKEPTNFNWENLDRLSKLLAGIGDIPDMKGPGHV